jgi:hypothetical protein
MGISPQYFLDEMSFDEMESLLIADRDRSRRELERDRMNWFYTVIAPGMSKAKTPEDILKFDWEKKTVEPRKLNKDQFEKKSNEAEQWLNNR